MSKKGNLSAALSQFDKRPDAAPFPDPSKATGRPEAAPVSRPDSKHTEGQGKGKLPPSRQGKKALTGYFEPEVLKQLKVMAAAEDTTIQALMTEAINDLFKKRGKPHIA